MEELGEPFISRLRYGEKVIMFADIVESVRLIERDERSAVGRIAALLNQASTRLVRAHGGSVVERRGDGLLLEFVEPRSAVACAAALHRAAATASERLPAEDALHLRVGIHRAGVFADTGTLYGHGVNLAARITAVAHAGETVVSAEAARDLVDGLDGELHDLGDCYLKHVESPVHLYRISHAGFAPIPFKGPGAPPSLHATVVVLPFTPYSEEASGFGIGDVLADQLIAALSRSNTLNVISRLSTSALACRYLSAPQVASLLHADFVVSGRYRREGGQLSVQAELASGSSGQVLWAEQRSDVESAALHLDSELVGCLLEGIVSAIFASQASAAASIPLPNLASHALLLAAIQRIYSLSRSDFDSAKEVLQVLHERAPRHPVPLAWLARWHLFRVVQGWSDDRDADGRAALVLANRALDIDPQSSLALTMAGNVHTSYLKDLQSAERLYARALAVNPNESLAWLQKGNALSFRGDGNGALTHIEKALSLSPFDPSRHFYESLLASAALSAGDYKRAMAAARSSLRLNRQHVSSYRVLAIAQSLCGFMEEAAETVRQLLVREPDLTVARFVARSPGGPSGLAEKFGTALHAAGLPLGDTAIRN